MAKKASSNGNPLNPIVKDVGKGLDFDVKDIGKGPFNPVKDIGKGGVTPAAIGSLLHQLGSHLDGWLVVSFISPVRANGLSSSDDSESTTVAGLRKVTADRDRADLGQWRDLVENQTKTLTMLMEQVNDLKNKVEGLSQPKPKPVAVLEPKTEAAAPPASQYTKSS